MCFSIVQCWVFILGLGFDVRSQFLCLIKGLILGLGLDCGSGGFDAGPLRPCTDVDPWDPVMEMKQTECFHTDFPA